MLRPMLHFLAIGALLFAADRVRIGWAEASAPHGRIALDAATLDRLQREAIAQTGLRPDPPALAARADRWIDEEILYREALRLGLDRGDPVVHDRLVRNMRFAVGPDDPRDDAALLGLALELGMDRSDIVVRRRLVQQMRFLLESRAAPVDPSDEALRAFVAAHPERYRIPDRVRLSHVYLSRDRRGARLEADARALLARLRAEALPPEAARTLGDPFLHPAELGLQSESQLARQLGAGFAARAIALAPGRWEGPVESAYGMHLVWVRERDPAHDPPLDTVRRSARSAMQAERNARVLAEELAALRARYHIDRSALLAAVGAPKEAS